MSDSLWPYGPWALPGPSVHGILQARKRSGLPCPPPRDLLDPGIEPTSLLSPALAGGFFTTSVSWEALSFVYFLNNQHIHFKDFLKGFEEWNRRHYRKQRETYGRRISQHCEDFQKKNLGLSNLKTTWSFRFHKICRWRELRSCTKRHT